LVDSRAEERAVKHASKNMHSGNAYKNMSVLIPKTLKQAARDRVASDDVTERVKCH